jgi:hypothetical protein
MCYSLRICVSILASYLILTRVSIQGITQYNYTYVLYIAAIGTVVYIMPLLAGSLASIAGVFFAFIPYSNEAALIFLGMAFLAFVSCIRTEVR